MKRRVLEDWQLGILRWPDAAAALGIDGLPALYVAAYRAGVPLVRRFADEEELPLLARQRRLTSVVWHRNPSWQGTWYRDFDRDRRLHGVGGPGHAIRRADRFERDVWWLLREQLSVHFAEQERDRQDLAADEERARRSLSPHPPARREADDLLDGTITLADVVARHGLDGFETALLRAYLAGDYQRALRRVLDGRAARRPR